MLIGFWYEVCLQNLPGKHHLNVLPFVLPVRLRDLRLFYRRRGDEDGQRVGQFPIALDREMLLFILRLELFLIDQPPPADRKGSRAH